jgi:hypothetical protein
MSDLTPLDAPITQLQLIRIASRLFAAFLLFWVVVDIIALPREVLSLTHELHNAVFAGSPWSAFAASHYVRYYILEVISNVLCIALWLMGAGWFYRCDPRIQRFFSPETVSPPLQPSSNLEP